MKIDVEYDRRVNLAMQQNAVPLIKAVRVTNDGDAPLVGVTLTLWVEPELAGRLELRIAEIAPGATFNLEKVDLRLLPERLINLTERESGTLHVEARAGEALVRQQLPLECLAYNEWSARSLPELLAAFVMPNHPAVGRLLAAARGHLEAGAAFDGYQSARPERVRAMAAAILTAAAKLGIAYVNPPASFEQEGQKVRTPEQVLGGRMATCLDLAVCLAAAFEQAGLHALVVLVDGHAFAGVWLMDESFPEAAVLDAVRVRKRVDLGELAVFECTAVCQGRALLLGKAEQDARRHLDDDAAFVVAVDVHAARRQRILPLPARIEERVFVMAEPGPGTAQPPSSREAPSSHEPESSREPVPASGAVPATSRVQLPQASQAQGHEREEREGGAARLERWRRKLLDLSLRNRLINFTKTKRSLAILCPDIAALEDALASGKSFALRAAPELMRGDDPRDRAVHEQRTGEDALAAHLLAQLRAGVLHVELGELELERRLIELFRAARLAREEGGASTLFLAVGFLSWFESAAAERARRAPILLLPVELERASVVSGFRLRPADDDARINVTLLQKMQAEFGADVSGLDELPEDEAGLDVPAILQRVRVAVRDMARWEVVLDVELGLFSFTKFLMWRDLEERSRTLMENAVVRHLLEAPGAALGALPELGDLDQERTPEQTFCPLDADSSQLGAVFAAADGASFVLEGPPGTGKSQTIANLIAHGLALGKSVLFVSEKMAALDVVHRRLGAAGLGPFCLELHSNKARKRDVVLQLGAALEAARQETPPEFAAEARKLEEARARLNGYVHAIHRRRHFGESVFGATASLIALRDAPRVALRFAADAVDRQRLAALREAVDGLEAAAARIASPREHLFRAVRLDDWQPALVRPLEEQSLALATAAAELGGGAAACAELGLGADASLDELWQLAELGELLLEAPLTPAALVTDPELEQRAATIGAWIATGRRRDAARAALLERWKPELEQLDLVALIQRHERFVGSFFAVRWLALRGARKTLRALARVPLGSPAQVRDDLRAARAVQEDGAVLRAAASPARRLLGAGFGDGDAAADWTRLEQAVLWAEQLRALAARAGGDDAARAAALGERWAALAEQPASCAPNAPIGRALRAFAAAFHEERVARQRLVDLLQLDEQQAFGAATLPGHAARVAAQATAFAARAFELRDWCAFLRARRGAEQLGLAALVQAHAEGALQTAQLPSCFERSFLEGWLEQVIAAETVLKRFVGSEHERLIERFRALDAEVMALAGAVVRARLCARLPSAVACSVASSEVGILMRELKKQRRHLPLRQLFQRIPNLLPRLKPCLLMSPLSVAQYLDASFPRVDLVVFDEASQIPVWDAIGAIGRGTQAVIVGDSRQLPPTSFFEKVTGDEALDENDFEELESILDECVAAGLPRAWLRWHYRSRHESLIAFSNWHYYENRLLTFPSPHAGGAQLGVHLVVAPSGHYDRGHSHTNRAEAELLVADLLRRLRDPAQATRSFGIVTFSQPQQVLIEDLLESERRAHPELEPRFTADHEPVFVKNLENVQGDERDVMLFSVCYGPDAAGKVTMNFGPLNRQGGERRLNVAITRAREELVVFSSLAPEHIDLARTSAVGAQHLRLFLDYAARGMAAIAEAVVLDPERAPQSPFERDVRDALGARGHAVHEQVGCSGYRIDLAVVDAQEPGRYVLGIECDGATYHCAATARDRDRLRELVLRRLGWRLHRVWSSDWWQDRAGELARLEQAIAAAQRAPRPGDRPAAPAAFAALPEAKSLAGSQGDGRAAAEDANSAAIEVVAREALGAEAPGGKGRAGEGALQSKGAAQAPAVEPPAVEPPAAQPPGAEPPAGQGPAPYAPLESTELGPPEAFYDGAAQAPLLLLLHRVLEREAPITFELLARRLANAHGIKRTTERVRERVGSLCARAGVTAIDGVLWAPSQDPAAWRAFRGADPHGPAPREAEEIPLIEVANAAEAALRAHVALPLEDLARETARQFGISRLGRTVRSRMTAGIEQLAARGGCIMDGSRVCLP